MMSEIDTPTLEPSAGAEATPDEAPAGEAGPKRRPPARRGRKKAGAGQPAAADARLSPERAEEGAGTPEAAAEHGPTPDAAPAGTSGADASDDTCRAAAAAARTTAPRAALAEETVRASIAVLGLDRAAPLPRFEADLVLAQERLVELAAGSGMLVEALPADIAGLEARLARAGDARVAILVDGDPLIDGPGRPLLAALGPERVRLGAAAGAMQRALTRVGLRIDEAEFVSLPSVGLCGLAARLRRGRIYAITPGDTPAQAVGRLLERAGFHQARVWLVEESGDAPVHALLAFELSDSRLAFSAGVQIIAHTALADGSSREWPGIPATELRQALPEAARLLALSWLQPGSEELGWCIEPGGAAVALDWSRCRPAAELHCIGTDEDTLDDARERHGAGEGLRSLESGSFRSLETLPDPDVVFIRAGEEFTQQVRTGWARLSPGGRMVVAAEDEQSRIELMQFAARELPARWQDLSVAEGSREGGRARFDATRSVRLMAWQKAAKG